jgi:hypothetical protein
MALHQVTFGGTFFCDLHTVPKISKDKLLYFAIEVSKITERSGYLGL